MQRQSWQRTLHHPSAIPDASCRKHLVVAVVIPTDSSTMSYVTSNVTANVSLLEKWLIKRQVSFSCWPFLPLQADGQGQDGNVGSACYRRPCVLWPVIARFAAYLYNVLSQTVSQCGCCCCRMPLDLRLSTIFTTTVSSRWAVGHWAVCHSLYTYTRNIVQRQRRWEEGACKRQHASHGRTPLGGL